MNAGPSAAGDCAIAILPAAASDGWSMMRLDWVASTTDAALPLAGEGWGGGAAAIRTVRAERVSPTRRALRAQRPPPQAGEVNRVRGETDSIKRHHYLPKDRPAMGRQRDLGGCAVA